jgi:hypothetical protein
MSFFNVDQTTPIGTFAPSTGAGDPGWDANATVNPSSSGEVIVATLAKIYNDPVTEVEQQGTAQRWNLSTTDATATNNVLGAGALHGGIDSATTVGWKLGGSTNGQPWAIGAVAVRPSNAEYPLVTTLSNYPMLYSVTDPDLRTTADGGNVESYDAPTNDPRDIIFIALDDTTCGGPGTSPCKLSHEIEKYSSNSTTAELTAWVRIPSVNGENASSNTVIYIYYGNNSITSSTQDKTAVWSGLGYVEVWHLSETDGPPPTPVNSVDLATGTSQGSVTADAGKIDGAYHLVPNGQPAPNETKLILGTETFSTNTPFTVETWFIIDTETAQWRGLATKGREAYTDPNDVDWFGLGLDNSARLRSYWDRRSGSNLDGSLVTDQQWYNAITTFDGGIRMLWLNGAEDTSTQSSSSGYPGVGRYNTITDATLAGNDLNGNSLNGRLDEIRVSNKVQPPGWLRTTYNNMNDPGDIGSPGFYTVGPQTGTTPGPFGFRKSITIDRTKISDGSCGTTLTNFPMLFSVTDGDLATTTYGGDVASYDAPTNDPRDIIFRALDDDTCGGLGTAPCTLYHEIEKYDETTGELVAWVRVPSVNTSAASSDTVIYIYYGNSDVTTSTQNVNGVWDDNYLGVWHLKEDPSGTSPQMKDSNNSNHGISGGDLTSDDQVPGQIDGSLDFDGGADAVYDEVLLPNQIIGNRSAWTITAWIKMGPDSANQRTIYSEGHTTGGDFLFLYVEEGGSNVAFYSDFPDPPYYTGIWGFTNVEDNQFHHVAMVQRLHTDRELFVDTVSQGTDDLNGETIALNTASIGYLRTDYGADPFLGIIDEIRISNIDRGACWIGAEYSNQKWPNKNDFPTEGFITLGVEEPTPATAVDLVSFTARGAGSSVLVEWETAQELNHMGFYLYRAKSPSGPFTRLTDKLISSLTFSVVGQKYSFEDKDVTAGEIYYYQLEDLDIYGKKTLHGPICVDWDGDGLPDDWEIAHGLNPGFDDSDLDWDGDGLTNLQEYLRGTDPFNPDTDGDGILDGDEGVKRDPDDQKISATLGPGVYLVASDETGTTLELRTDTFDFDIVQADGQEFERLRIKDYIHGFTDEVGKPELPLKGILVDIPYGSSATLTVLETEAEVHTGYRIYPVPETVVDDQDQLSHVGETFVIDEAAYTVDAFYPDASALLGKECFFRGQQKQQIFFYPLTFNPATGELRHLRRIRVRVDYVDAGAVRSSGPEPTAWKPPVEEELSVDAFSMLAAAAWEPPSQTETSPVYKILVSEEGICRLTKSWLKDQLEAQGLAVPAIDLSQVRIYNLGQEIAISVYDENGDTQFDSEDYIGFYGRAVDDTYAKYTKNNVYWLTLEGGVGAPKRMAAIDGTPGSATVPSTHTFTVHHEEDRKYWLKAPGNDSLDRYFFDPYLIGGEVLDAAAGVPVSFNLFLPGIPDQGTQGTLTIMMAGTYAPDHQVAVSLNGTPLGTYSWNDIAFYEATIEGVDLLNGNNTVTLQCLTGVDAIAVDWFEVTYPSSFAANDDSLKFTYETGYLFQVSGFTTDTIMAFDITSPGDVERLVNFKTTDAGGPGPYTLDFEPESAPGERTYLVLTSDQVKTPAAIIEDVYGNLANPANEADYIIITHRDVGWYLDSNGNLKPYQWLTDLTALRADKQAQGLHVKVVDVEDVFDEFSYGIESPGAIRDFLTYAYTSWTPPAPQYVLLVGDSTRNPKNNPDPSLGLDTVTTYIPTYLTFTEHMGETATDEWFVRVSGDDGISDLYIGRLPAKSAAEATIMANKIKAYEQSQNTKSWEKNVLLIADNRTEDYEALFKSMNEDALALIPAGMNNPVTGYLDSYLAAGLTSGDLTKDIKDTINGDIPPIEGVLMVNYSGHGSIRIWANESIFQNMDVADLDNGFESPKFPFFVSMSCLNGHFVYPESWNFPSLAETLLRAGDKGAAAALMSTGQTTPEGQHILDSALFDAIFNQDVRVLGQAVSSAKQTLMANGDSTYEEVNETFLLFGDPAMTLRVPLPHRPQGLRAQGHADGVLLSWDEAKDCNGATVSVSGYNLYRSTTPGGPYTKVNTSLITGIQYDDLAVSSTMAQSSSSAASSSGTFYYYVVTSVDAQGDESVYSQEASGGTQSANPPASESSGGGGGGCFINTVTGN